MKYYRFNQIAMAVLGALLLFFGAKTIIQIAQEEHEPEKPGYEVAGTEDTKKGGEAKPGGAELATLLAGADVARGAEVAKKCAICHTFDKGGANLIGPNLYGVLGRKIASHEGYEYSEALKAKGGDWDYAMLDDMTENPSVFAPGTKMALFPGLPDAKQRADVIVFLRSKNDNPPPLPEAVAAPAEGKPPAETPAGGAPAGGSEILALLATADPKQGETDAALCKVCHTFDKGGAVLVGPNLYGVVGKKIASQEGVNYTPALKSKQGDWTYENLDLWLANPQAFAPGTTMAFPGVPDVKKRANIVVFLRGKSDSPAPLPAAAGEAAQPADKAAETPAAPAEAAPPAAGTPAAEPEAPAAQEAAPSAETPPAAETPAAEPEAPAAQEAAPSTEAPPVGETPAAEPEAPAAQEAAPSAATPPAAETPAAEPETPATQETAPSTETPPAAETPAAEPEAPAAQEAAPSAETPPAAETPAAEPEAPATQETAPSAETPPAAEAEPAPSEPSMGEGPSPSQPQPVYPEGPPEGVE